MRADPRCPSCDGKVSASADWCMHCGREFDAPVDRSRGSDDSDSYGDGDGGLIGRISGSDRKTDDPVTARGGTVQRERERTRQRRDWSREAGDAWSGSDDTASERPAVPSGRGNDGPSYLPIGGLSNGRVVARFLGVLALLGAVGTVAGLSLPAIGAGLAILAWLGSIGWLARQRSGFDAMRYGSFSVMVLLIFVSFALAMAAEGQSLLAFLLTMVPVGIAALFVAGFGYTMGETT